MKKWSFNKVKEALKNILLHLENEDSVPCKYTAYYVGGSLCIDFDYYPNVILNRNGRGSFYGFSSGYDSGTQKFVMTNDMRDAVLTIYAVTTRKKEASTNPGTLSQLAL